MSSHVALEPTSGLWGWWNSNCSGATPLGGCSVQGAPAASPAKTSTRPFSRFSSRWIALSRTAPSPNTSCAAGEMPPNAACNLSNTRAGSNGKTRSSAAAGQEQTTAPHSSTSSLCSLRASARLLAHRTVRGSSFRGVRCVPSLFLAARFVRLPPKPRRRPPRFDIFMPGSGGLPGFVWPKSWPAVGRATRSRFEPKEAQQRWPVSLRFLAACSRASHCWSKN